jgi:hypothetical protein
MSTQIVIQHTDYITVEWWAALGREHARKRQERAGLIILAFLRAFRLKAKLIKSPYYMTTIRPHLYYTFNDYLAIRDSYLSKFDMPKPLEYLY